MNAKSRPAGAVSGKLRPQALQRVVVTPAGILAALMLYFFPQYIQVIAFVPVFCRPDFAGSGFSAFVLRFLKDG